MAASPPHLVVRDVNHVGGNVGEGIDNGARDMAVLLPPGLTRPVHSMARLHSRLTATHKKTLPDRNQSINHKVSE